VIEAIHDGKRAAIGIDAFIRGVSAEEAGSSGLDSSYYYRGEDRPTELLMTKLQKHQNSYIVNEYRERLGPKLLEAGSRVVVWIISMRSSCPLVKQRQRRRRSAAWRAGYV
jgi:hypothetical protein